MTDAYHHLPEAEDGGPELVSPGYVAPAVTVRATWSATDGSRPEEVYVDWKEPPPASEMIAIVRTLLNSGAEVRRFDALPNPAADPTRCPAEADLGERGSFAHFHHCKLEPGHEPVEPEGRQHRCGCGGIFAADGEVPDVPRARRRDDD